MNKRGQIYIFSAIIVCMVAFVLVAKSNTIREQVLLDNFKDISSNYLTESPKVINNALGTQTADLTPEQKLKQIEIQLSTFTGSFVNNYAKNQDPGVGLIYIYNDENGVVIQNSLNNEVAHFNVVGGGQYNLLSTTDATCGKIVIEGTGAGSEGCSNLCGSSDPNKNYCILTSGISGDINLVIESETGGAPINYNFNINPESPELIVILKSQDKNTVKVDVSESAL